MKEFNINFQFKAQRDYVHGTDLFNKSMEFLSGEGFVNIKNIDMKIHSILRSHCNGVLFKEKENVNLRDYPFILTFNINKEKFELALKSNSEKIFDRYTYEEQDIVDLCNVDVNNESILLTSRIGYSNIEKIVAMNKALLESLFNQVKGKWYFVRLQLKEAFEKKDFEFYEIKLVKNLNFKLTKSEILLEDKVIGYIYFSLI